MASKDQKNIVSFNIIVFNTGDPESKTEKEPEVMCKTSFRADSNYTDSIREHLSGKLAEVLKNNDVENDTPEIVTDTGVVAGVICLDTPEGLFEWKEEWEATLGTVKNQKVNLYVREHFKSANDGDEDDEAEDALSAEEEDEEEEGDFDLPDENEQGSDEDEESEEAEGEPEGEEEEEEPVKAKKPAARKRKAAEGENGENGNKPAAKAKKTKKDDASEYSSDKEGEVEAVEAVEAAAEEE